MRKFLHLVQKTTQIFNVLGGISLTFLMLLTVLDVILRGFKHPIAGTYELVGFSGALAIGLALPYTCWCRGHVFVDFLLAHLPKTLARITNTFTRVVSLILFLFFGWRLLSYGNDLKRMGEVSLTLQLPFYPVAWALAVTCWLVCLVLISDLVKIHLGEYE